MRWRIPSVPLRILKKRPPQGHARFAIRGSPSAACATASTDCCLRWYAGARSSLSNSRSSSPSAT
eukprot:11043831-Lingulodinium_polyedra.AAC.1